MVWYGMVWYGMVSYGTVRYGMVRCGMVPHLTSPLVSVLANILSCLSAARKEGVDREASKHHRWKHKTVCFLLSTPNNFYQQSLSESMYPLSPEHQVPSILQGCKHAVDGAGLWSSPLLGLLLLAAEIDCGNGKQKCLFYIGFFNSRQNTSITGLSARP